MVNVNSSSLALIPSEDNPWPGLAAASVLVFVGIRPPLFNCFILTKRLGTKALVDRVVVVVVVVVSTHLVVC